MDVRQQNNTDISRQYGKQYKQVSRKNALPFWFAAVIWLLFALLFPMYKTGVFIFCILLSAIVFWFLRLILPKEMKTVEEYRSTGDRELDEIIDSVDDTLLEIQKAGSVIASKKPQTAVHLKNINQSIVNIRKLLLDKPEFRNELRRFLDYYLPTVEKLVVKYAYLLSHNQQNEEQTATMERIEAVLVTVDSAFEKQYHSLFRDENLDISTDIKVLETMLKRDNLSE